MGARLPAERGAGERVGLSESDDANAPGGRAPRKRVDEHREDGVRVQLPSAPGAA